MSLGLLARARALAAGGLSGEVEVPVRIRLARTDFSAFCEVMGKPNARHHLDWIREFITEETNDRLLRVVGPDTAILCPRGSGKSVVLGLFVAWLVGIHAEAKRIFRVLYLSYSLDVARSKSFAIKGIIKSSAYREIFPSVVLSKTRTSDELWSIDPEVAGIDTQGDDFYSCVAQGLGGSITSRRADLICLDDVIKSADSIANPEIRAKLISNWQQVVRPCLLDGGRSISLGTRFSTVDMYGTTFTEKNGWRIVREQAILADDNGIEYSYWPDMWSLPYLQKLRREDPISFSFQFQNHPVSQSTLDFPRSWLKKAPPTNSYDMVCVGIDLSSGLKERNDYTVMTLGCLRGDKVELFTYEKMRAMGNLEKIDALCEMLADPSVGLLVEQDGRYLPTDYPVTIFLEEISYQQSIRGDMKAILHDERGLHNLVLRGVKGYRGDKLSRFRGIMGLFQTGRVTWNESLNWEPYWDELLNFGYTDHDDCVDSLVLTIKGLIGSGRLEVAWGDWDQGLAA